MPLETTTFAATDADLLLLERFREEGDQEAFAEIVRRYAAAVFSTCVRILGDRARADDVSQETFFRLSQKPEAVKQSLGGWLHTAATRLAIDAVRSEASRAQREANYERKPPSEAMKWADVSPHVDEALAALPDETRMLLVRHFLQNVNQCTLAGELRTSPATVSRKIKAGVELLRKQLSRKGICIAAAILITLMRDHGAQAAPAELMRELGKITMLSGGKPAGVAPPSATTFACGWWWVAAIGVLAGVFAVLFVGLTNVPRPVFGAPSVGQQQHEERRDEPERFRQQRLQAFRHAGIGG
ncbi:MAG TPA: RNA polymerase sigma factor [Tepidisphaeraceae bacterium]|jgi:RNA polymerase sigma-70 factor (ECF subfamily)